MINSKNMGFIDYINFFFYSFLNIEILVLGVAFIIFVIFFMINMIKNLFNRKLQYSNLDKKHILKYIFWSFDISNLISLVLVLFVLNSPLLFFNISVIFINIIINSIIYKKFII